MRSAKKGSNWHFGMKMHIGVDKATGIIHTVVTTPANVHDVLFRTRYVTSGMTRSMPSISSLGKIDPQSTTMMSSPYSKTVMFLPISSTPPSGMIRSLDGNSATFSSFQVVLFLSRPECVYIYLKHNPHVFQCRHVLFVWFYAGIRPPCHSMS